MCGYETRLSGVGALTWDRENLMWVVKRPPRPRRMTYFVVDVKIEVVDMKVRVPTELELHELDLPRGRYGFLKTAEFCRSGNRNSAEIGVLF